ncbi:hypothetical protein [Pseudogemmobacter bohemicus]|uniref:hypothetical protein n=1 Tax=Pseudogemmobacter bohemicus TaxID=2250708 RepID=UPI000DD34F36|nr:hypothetical protein [Pseudogemmobacter bohemicus]
MTLKRMIFAAAILTGVFAAPGIHAASATTRDSIETKFVPPGCEGKAVIPNPNAHPPYGAPENRPLTPWPDEDVPGFPNSSDQSLRIIIR